MTMFFSKSSKFVKYESSFDALLLLKVKMRTASQFLSV